MKVNKIKWYRLILTSLMIGNIVFLLLSGPLGPYHAQATSYEQSVQRWTGSFEVHDPIRITSNANFTASNGVSGGSGTPASPWIIENWIIFAGGEGSGIFLANTTDWFIIRKCSLWEASSEMFQAGIVLQNVTNARLEDNNCYSNGWCGIYVGQTNDSFLENNWCWDTLHIEEVGQSSHNRFAMSGIFLNESHGNLLANNNCTNNMNGISLAGCENNTIQQNTFQNNFVSCIFLEVSDSNIIIENVGGNTNFPIWFKSANNNLIEQNAFRNLWYGFHFDFLDNSTGNLLQLNSIFWCAGHGNIVCSPDCENILKNNILLNNYFSILYPEVFGYYSQTAFWPGITGWLLGILTLIIWIAPPLKKRELQHNQKKELQALNMKEDYYTHLKKEHCAVLAQLDPNSQSKKTTSEGV